MSPSELKAKVEAAGHDPYFFSRGAMKFFGDRMSNYGVRSGVCEDGMEVWELYRKRPVRNGLKSSALFAKSEFKRYHKNLK